MSLFINQPIYCGACGKAFLGNPGKACSRTCEREIEWMKTLYILGKEYYPGCSDCKAGVPKNAEGWHYNEWHDDAYEARSRQQWMCSGKPSTV